MVSTSLDVLPDAAKPSPSHESDVSGEPTHIRLHVSNIALQCVLCEMLAEKSSHEPFEQRQAFNKYFQEVPFISVATAIVENEGPSILQTFGIKFSEEERVWLHRISEQPSIILTPPEDGNRAPQPGEHGGGPVRVRKRLLVPPQTIPKLGKWLKEQEKKKDKAKKEQEKNTKREEKEQERRKIEAKLEAELLQAMFKEEIIRAKEEMRGILWPPTPDQIHKAKRLYKSKKPKMPRRQTGKELWWMTA